MRTLFEWLLVQLKIKCWGVALENEIPAEFVVTAHARKRLRERLVAGMTGDEVRKLAIRAYYRQKLTAEEARASEDMPRGLVDFQYRLHLGLVFVYGTKPRGEYSQKYLVTVYKHRSESEYNRYYTQHENSRTTGMRTRRG